MLKYNNNKLLITFFILISILSLFIGFFLNEDLSTGGSEFDFNLTWRVIVDFSNLNFEESYKYTRHVPLHYLILSVIYKIFNDQYLVRLIYLFLSLLLPYFLYLNLTKIYNYPKITLLLLSFSIILLPYFRGSAIWPNAHLTALFFLIIGNYFYLKSINENKFIFSSINLFFLACATYTMQTYVIFFIYYLSYYFINKSKIEFLKLFLFCILLGLPGLYFITFNDRIADITISKDFYYSLVTNFSIIAFFLIIFTLNKDSFSVIKKIFLKLSKIEIFSILILFFFIIYNFEYPHITGGGFFYKVSKFLLNNNLIFFISFLIGMVLSLLLIKKDKNFIIIFLLMNGMALNYQIFQKYFEPVFMVMILIMYKNFLTNNIVKNINNIFIFNSIILSYYFLALINFLYKFSNNLNL